MAEMNDKNRGSTILCHRNFIFQTPDFLTKRFPFPHFSPLPSPISGLKYSSFFLVPRHEKSGEIRDAGPLIKDSRLLFPTEMIFDDFFYVKTIHGSCCL
jgi:hypothetical protein